MPHNPTNVRLKRHYFAYLKEARRQSEATVDAVAKSLDRFEVYTRHRDFRSFHINQAIGFKAHLAGRTAQQSGRPLSKATLYTTLMHLKGFFYWLAGQPGFRSRLKYTDADYFNPSESDARVATARREQAVPTPEQIHHVIRSMPSGTEIERRNRALIAFIFLTGARDRAVASMSLKHVDLEAGCAYQDAREVRTKNSKTFTTYFFPVGGDVREIVEEWVTFLKKEKLWGNDDPLFPATEVAVGSSRQFEATGLKRKHWSSAAPIRGIFRDAFRAAGLRYFNPHSIRNTLVRVAEKICRTPEEFKAWSQSLGHEGVLTTFLSYGSVPPHRQAEVMLNLASPRPEERHNVRALVKELARELRDPRPQPTPTDRRGTSQA